MRARGLFGPCLYRRVVIWVITSLIVVGIILFKTQDVGVYDVAVSQLTSFGHSTAPEGAKNAPSTPEESQQKVRFLPLINNLPPREMLIEHVQIQQPGQEPQQNSHGQLVQDPESGGQDEYVESEEERKNRVEMLKRLPWLAFKQSVLNFPLSSSID